MKKALLLSLLVAACGTGGPLPTNEGDALAPTPSPLVQSSVWHSTWNGRNASASFGNEFENGYLEAWESRDGKQSGAALWYSLYRQDPTSEVCVDECFCFGPPPVLGGDAGLEGEPGGEPESGACEPGCFDFSYCYYTRYSYEDGYGEIPAADFKANAKAAILDTTVTTGETFFVHRCVFDEEAPDGGGCEELEGTVSIAARFRADGEETYFSSGISRSSYGDSSYQSQGTYRGASADAEGNIGDTVFNTQNASIGSSHSANVDRQVTREP